jgi:hypothetical protein
VGTDLRVLLQAVGVLASQWGRTCLRGALVENLAAERSHGQVRPRSASRRPVVPSPAPAPGVNGGLTKGSPAERGRTCPRNHSATRFTTAAARRQVRPHLACRSANRLQKDPGGRNLSRCG